MTLRLSRLVLVSLVLVLLNLPLRTEAQSARVPVTGTWEGPVHCLHGDGDAFTMSIVRDASGRYSGTMDWGLAFSDGQRGPGAPLTTVTVGGSKVTATAVDATHAATLEAVVDGDRISGEWRLKGADDVWSFTGTRQ